LSALIPNPVSQPVRTAATSPALWRVETSVAMPSGEDRDGMRARGRAAAWEQTRAQTILPPERDDHAPRGPRRTRAQDIPAYWPTAVYFVQHLSQEALPAEGPAIAPARGAARYPSLALDSDIILPDETFAASRSMTGRTVRRIDITV
jgi:hypothetical protein